AAGKSGEPAGVAQLWSKLSPGLQQSLADVPEGKSPDKAVKQQVADELNALFALRDVFTDEALASVDRRTEAGPILRTPAEKRSDDEVFRLNRLVFESLFPRSVVRSFADVVLMRTTSKLLAIDFSTGKRVWDVPLDPNNDPIQRLLQSDGSGNPGMQTGQLAAGLGRRLWHDATFGSISSDGRLVFSVEDLGVYVAAQNPYSGVRMVNHQANSPLAPKDYNRLAAHDIRTGKRVWKLGGPKGETDQKLAGLYFLGPPLPLAGQLYVLAESSSEVRLLVLDAASGELAWSQNLCEARAPIAAAQYRARSGVSPSYADGVLVCPTSAGAVVAVDLTSRSLLWGYRYSNLEVEANTMQMGVFGVNPAMFPNQNEDRWTDSLSIISDGHALITPIESNELHCLRLTDGALVWKRPRNDALYAACVYGGNVILVGKQQTTALKLTDGSEVWKTPMPEATAHPSGRGFLSENYYYLPLSTAEVACLDLSNGRIVAKSKARSERAPGNLICFKGTVLSQGVDYLESF
ncbi:MAG TPA: PQQ-binding-like beta-propeller repeat protein, partial [Pirellulales bacterium]